MRTWPNFDGYEVGPQAFVPKCNFQALYRLRKSLSSLGTFRHNDLLRFLSHIRASKIPSRYNKQEGKHSVAKKSTEDIEALIKLQIKLILVNLLHKGIAVICARNMQNIKFL